MVLLVNSASCVTGLQNRYVNTATVSLRRKLPLLLPSLTYGNRLAHWTSSDIRESIKRFPKPMEYEFIAYNIIPVHQHYYTQRAADLLTAQYSNPEIYFNDFMTFM